MSKHSAHNQGEKDYGNGNYNPPHSSLDKATAAVSDGLGATQGKEDEMRSENKSYSDGWQNARKQDR